MKPRWIAAFAAVLIGASLTGCSVPTAPDFTYFRLPRPAPLEAASPVVGVS